MASILKHIRSTTADKRPTGSGLADGQIAINTASGTPGVFFKNSAGTVTKVGPTHVGAAAPNVAPAGSAGNSIGETWVDNSTTTHGLKYYTGSAFYNLTPSGTTTVVGLVELATDAETQAGSDSARAVTPSSLQSKVSDSISTSGSTTIASSLAVKNAYDLANAALPKTGGRVTGNLEIGPTGTLSFEGSSDDGFETTFAVVNPTTDNTITFPNISGTVVTGADTGTVTSAMILDGTIVNGDISAAAAIGLSKLAAGALPSGITVNSDNIVDLSIVNADINASAAIVDTKLATIATAGKVSNSATTATSGNTANAIVARDASGDFTAGTITATLIGNASTVTTNANLTGDITSVGNATSIANGAIVNDDVNASAAIAGSKISPNFGSQTVQTTGIFSAAAGTAAAPSVAFTGDTDTGLYSPGVNQAAISIAGSERARIDSSGRLLVGTSSARNNFFNAATSSIFQVEGAGGAPGRITSQVFGAANVNGPIYVLAKHRGAAVGGTDVINDADQIGTISFQGSDGTEFVEGATIAAFADGTPGANDMPGRLVFSTTADGAGSPTERMRITSTGAVTISTGDLTVYGATVGRGAGAIISNTAVGNGALAANTTGTANTAVGRNVLLVNTTGANNTANGANALAANTTAGNNTAMGSAALLSNTTGANNTAVGLSALAANTTGSQNAAFGLSALSANTTGNDNTAYGAAALQANTTGASNTAVGRQALIANTTGTANTANGVNALGANTTGTNNTATGLQALLANTTGTDNTANGIYCLQANTTGINNVANGIYALASNTIGTENTAVGRNALLSTTSGTTNTAIGNVAGSTNTTGGNNSFVGNNAQGASATASNVITLGNASIATLRCQVTTITSLSDARDKTNIVTIPAGLDIINALRPVAFDWNTRDGQKVGIHEFGFIAQELQEAQESTGITVPNLVSTENPEKLEASAGTLLPVLVSAVQELTTIVKDLQEEIAALKAE